MGDMFWKGVVLAKIRPPAAGAGFPAVPGAGVADEITKAVDAGAAPGEMGDVVVAEDFAALAFGWGANVGQVAK
jgi:hypothetical protein